MLYTLIAHAVKSWPGWAAVERKCDTTEEGVVLAEGGYFIRAGGIGHDELQSAVSGTDEGARRLRRGRGSAAPGCVVEGESALEMSERSNSEARKRARKRL